MTPLSASTTNPGFAFVDHEMIIFECRFKFFWICFEGDQMPHLNR